MAIHEVVTYANKTSTATTAPFLGRYMSKSTVTSANFFADVAKELGVKVDRVQMIMQELLETIQEDFKLQAAKYNLKAFSIAPVVSGAFTSVNQQFSWLTDTYCLQFYFGKEMRDYLAGITPRIAADGDATKVKINHVQGTNMPTDVIDGYGEFIYQGRHLNMTDAGACAYVLKPDGTKEAIITTPADETNGTAHLFSPVAVGTYDVCFASRGGDTEGPLQTATKVGVKILAGTAPTPDPTMPQLLMWNVAPATTAVLANFQIDTEETAPVWPESLTRVEYEASNGRTGYLTAENMGAGVIQVETGPLWQGDQKLKIGDKIKVWAKLNDKLSNALTSTITT